MKKCISYWSFEGGLDAKAPLARCFREAKANGFPAVEPALGDSGELTPATTRKECDAIRADAKASGIEMSSLATGLFWGKSLTASDPAVRDEAVDIGRSLIEKAAWLGLDAVLVVPGAVDVFFLEGAEKVPYDECYKRSQRAIRKLVPFAEKHKVKIGVENVWNKFLLSPLEMRDFIDSFGSKYVGAYFDVGNVMLTGFPHHWIKILGRRLVRIHVKDFKTSVGTAAGFCDLLEGDVPWKDAMTALKAARYKSFVTAEMIPWNEGLIARTSKAMDQILAFAK